MSDPNTSFISCMKWIKRGVAKSKPEIVRLTKGELKELAEATKDKILKAKEETRKAKRNENGLEHKSGQNETNPQNSMPDKEDVIDDFNMKDYDIEEGVDLASFANLISVDDIEDINPDEDEYEEDSEKEDDEIKPTDNLIAVGHVYEDVSTLQVYVYNENNDDLYCHHDFLLPTIPLALEWLSHDPANTHGNLLAIGGMLPEITIWNMDIVNSIEPLTTLGRFSKTKRLQHRNHGHKEAVLDLSWNTKLTHILASGSVDKSIVLWDLDKRRAVTQFNFPDKVQSIEWHPMESNLLLVGAMDSMVRLLDCRAEESVISLRVKDEVERVAWHPSHCFNVLVGTSKGEVYYTDIRKPQKFLWLLEAHSEEVTGIGVHEDNPNTLVTCSMDKTIKVWNLHDKTPVLTNTKIISQGLQCLGFCPENPNIYCVGGNGKSNNFRLFDLRSDNSYESEVNGKSSNESVADSSTGMDTD